MAMAAIVVAEVAVATVVAVAMAIKIDGRLIAVPNWCSRVIGIDLDGGRAFSDKSRRKNRRLFSATLARTG
jgi:hypothetical protein